MVVLILSAEKRVMELIERMSVFGCSPNCREWRMFLYGSSYSGFGVFALFALSSNGRLFLNGFQDLEMDVGF